tara:strand:- start:1204 stop:2346 length:1143 start_codon:yes stop_codon:yes gene_type:complete
MHTFLPTKEPLKSYRTNSRSLKKIAEVASSLPKLLLTNKVQITIDSLNKKAFSINKILKEKNNDEINLAMSHLSFIAHAYIWGGHKPQPLLPEVIAEPWVKLANYLGRPPILSYASYCLDNWYKINKQEPISLNNVALINNFLGGVDEDWFVTIHVCIEDAASGAVDAAYKISHLDKNNSVNDFLSQLKQIRKSLIKVNDIFSKMPQKCDPYVYYHRVRPYIFGTKDNPDLKKGLIYENQYDNKPQFFRGETGAQSSIIPFLDGALGIGHTNDNLKHYLNEMRDYMPPKHRKMIEKVENKSQAKEIILKSKLLTKEYNHCVEEIRKFRAQHLEYAATYIHKQAQVKSDVGTGGSVVRGTGGTPFMKYLKKHRDETANQKI